MATGFGGQSWGADPGSGGGSGAVPTVVLRSPVTGIKPNDLIVFDVLYSGTVGNPVVAFNYHSYGIGEQVYSPTTGLSLSFRMSSSSVVSITGGYRFSLRRIGGWPAAPTIEAQ